MYLWCWDYLADKKKVVDFRSPVARLRRKSRGVERIPGNSFERKYGCKIAAILLSNTSFTHTGNYGSTTWTKRGAASGNVNDNVRGRPPSADYNIVGSYNLQPERDNSSRDKLLEFRPRIFPYSIPASYRWLATI
jgi:hypothetical protein